MSLCSYICESGPSAGRSFTVELDKSPSSHPHVWPSFDLFSVDYTPVFSLIQPRNLVTVV